MFALHRHNHSFTLARPQTFQRLICQRFFLTFACYNALLGRDFVRGISSSPCPPGAALDAGLDIDISCLGFPHHLLLFLSYSEENPRGKEKKKTSNQTTSQSPGGFPTSIFRSKAERNSFVLLVLGNPGHGCVFVPTGMGLRQ